MEATGFITTAEPTTETAPGMADITVPATTPMARTAAPTRRRDTIPQPALTLVAHQLRPRMARKKWGKRTTRTREPTEQPIKAPTRIRSGEAPRCRRTARRLTRSITRMQTEPWAPPKVQMATSTRPRTATFTKTPGAAGRAPILMLRTVGEAAATRTITAATPTITADHHLHSAAGEATDRVATPAGGPDPRARRAGAAEAVVAGGAAVAAVVGAVVVRFKDGRRAS